MGGFLTQLRRFVASPREVIQQVTAGAVTEAQDAQAVEAVASQVVPIREISDSQKKELRTFDEADVINTGRGARGVNARFEVWKRGYDPTSKRNTQAVAPITDGYAENVFHEPRFLVTQMSMPQRERFSIMRTFGADQNFFMTFGQEPRIWNIGGILPRVGIPSESRDWYRHFTDFYNTRLRADLMVQKGEFAVLIVGHMLIEGYVLSFDVNLDSQMDDVSAPFTMSFFVRSSRFLDSNTDESGTTSLLTDTGRPGSQWRLILPQPVPFDPSQVPQPTPPPPPPPPPLDPTTPALPPPPPRLGNPPPLDPGIPGGPGSGGFGSNFP